MTSIKKISTVTDTITCTRCGTVTKDAYVSKSDLHKFSGKLPVCKSCVEEIYNELFQMYGDHKKAVFYMCRRFDMPFTYNTYSGALKEANKKGWLIHQAYFKQLNSLGGVNKTGTSFDDSDNWIPEHDNDYVSGIEYTISEEDINFWGKGYSKEDLTFLQNYYNDLIKMYDHSLPVQINNYKNMAKTQLQGNKCLENGDITGYEKAMKILSMLSGDSNIKPNQESSVGNLTKGGFEVFIKHIEDDEPILDWEKDLGNINQLKSMLNIYFFGHLAKALNIINPWKSDYDEEMKKYTIQADNEDEDNQSVDLLGDI